MNCNSVWLASSLCLCVCVCVCVNMLACLQAAFSDFLQRSSRDLSKHVRVVVSVNTLSLSLCIVFHVDMSGQQVGLVITHTVLQLLFEHPPCSSVLQPHIESFSETLHCRCPLTSVLGLEEQTDIVISILLIFFYRFMSEKINKNAHIGKTFKSEANVEG